MSDALPPCYICGAEPPEGADWEVAQAEVGGRIEEGVRIGAIVVPATHCPTCKARAFARETGAPPPEQDLPAIDDITYARRLIGGPFFAAYYPRIAAQLDAVIGRIEAIFTPRTEHDDAVDMPDWWAVSTEELVALVAALLHDVRLRSLSKAVAVLVDARFTAQAMGALTSEDISAKFGTSRVPPHALRQVEALIASPSLAEMAGVAVEERQVAARPGAILYFGDDDRDPRD